MFESFFSALYKIGTFLNFSYRKNNSSDKTVNATTKSGRVASTYGNNSPIHIGDVHYYLLKKEMRETTSYIKSWESLLGIFSPESAQRLARMINNPKSKDPQKLNLNGYKKWLSQQFENIGLHHSDPRATEFNRIRKESIISIEKLYDCGEQTQFEKAWANHLFHLEAIINLESSIRLQ